MKNTLKIAVLLTLAVLTAFAQLTTTSTTLSTAIAANTTTQWCLASATGVSVPSLSGNTTGTFLLVDKEVAQVQAAGTSATCFKVHRGVMGTSANWAHASGALVWVGNAATGTGDTSRPFSGGAFINVIPSGTCTASAQYTLPVILAGIPGGASMVFVGDTYYCIGGYWSRGVMQNYPPASYVAWYTLPVMPSGTSGLSAITHVDGKSWFSQLYIGANSTVTGACWMNGATVTTDNTIAVLWDGAGNVLANSAVAGAADTGYGSVFECAAFLTAVNVTGPGTYFVGIQTKGTTDNFYTYLTNFAPSTYATGSKTGTFGTITAITPTTSFTTGVGPVMFVY